VYQAHTPAAWRRNSECGISGTDWANKKNNFFQKKVLKKFVGSKKSSTFALAFDKEPPCIRNADDP